jgi:hypothetical protein
MNLPYMILYIAIEVRAAGAGGRGCHSIYRIEEREIKEAR